MRIRDYRPMLARVTLDDLLAAGSVYSDTNGCWIWNQKVWSNGYGKFKSLRAHRVAYVLVFGDPGQLLVCHGCDVKQCVNPNHLWAGEQLDNIHDMINKGRKVVMTGDQHPSKRLSHRQKLTTNNPMSRPEVRQKVTGQLH